MPYDYYCPSTKLNLHERTCSSCGIYFASKKFLAHHVRKVHKREKINSTECRRVNPIKIIRFRSGEALCITRDVESSEEIKWIDVEDIDAEILANSELPNEEDSAQNQSDFWDLPVIDQLADWVSTPWVEDEGRLDSNA